VLLLLTLLMLLLLLPFLCLSTGFCWLCTGTPALPILFIIIATIAAAVSVFPTAAVAAHTIPVVATAKVRCTIAFTAAIATSSHLMLLGLAAAAVIWPPIIVQRLAMTQQVCELGHLQAKSTVKT
jgi:hypothetical protein